MAIPKNFNAIIACGGQSTRMGQDKSLIAYHHQPQRYYLYDLLTEITDDVYLSVNKNQSSSISPGYNFFTDQFPYIDCGPIAGILSAFVLYPEKNILCIGCDYPFINKKELETFLDMVQPDKPAAFYNTEADCYEPLIAWYPYCIAEQMTELSNKGVHSLQSLLISCNACKYIPCNSLSIFSADNPNDYKKALELLIRT